jgi:hypothetical protein
MAAVNTATLLEGLAAIETVLTGPPEEPGWLWQVVCYSIGWTLEDRTDEGTKEWLRQVAITLRRHLPHAPSPPPGLYRPGELG